MQNGATAGKAGKTNYGTVKEVALRFDRAVERTREVLKDEGFGILSEIRMDEKFKEKLDVDFRDYVILGACNPPLAYKAVQEDLNIGLLLPCNVVVYEGDTADTSVVAAIDAEAMMSIVGENADVKALASEVNEKLNRAIRAI